MQTISLKELKQHSDSWYQHNQPIVATNHQNQYFLVVPLSPEQWKSFLEKETPIRPTAFFHKWHGILKDSNSTSDWKDDYCNYLIEKYK